MKSAGLQSPGQQKWVLDVQTHFQLEILTFHWLQHYNQSQKGREAFYLDTLTE